ncbi:MAG: monofunctional biosynthetic peptidoglycan transglycosylase [Calditrichia bacterium]
MKKTSKLKWICRIFAIPLGVLLLGGIFLAVTWLTLPDINWLKDRNPQTTAFIQAEGFTNINLRKAWIPLKRISLKLQRAVILAEDASFWSHGGIDWYEIKESVVGNLKKGKLFRGGSTITQQVCKNLFFSKEKSFYRKIREMLLARKIESRLSKSRILEIYLNIVQWGRGIYGINTAAHKIFGKSPAQLNWDESIRLAAVLPNPVHLNPKKTDKKIYWRLKVILTRLHHYGDISDLEYKALRADYNLRYRLGN